MNLTCSKCGRQLKINDSEIPAGPFKVKCSGCGNVVVSIDKSDASLPAPAEENGGGSEQPALDKNALICDSDAAVRQFVAQTLKTMGYAASFASTAEEAIKQIESESYDLVTVDSLLADDKSGGEKILAKLNSFKSAQRHQIFLVLLSSSVPTAPVESSFLHGANLCVNKKDVKDLKRLLLKGQQDLARIYRHFQES